MKEVSNINFSRSITEDQTNRLAKIKNSLEDHYARVVIPAALAINDLQPDDTDNNLEEYLLFASTIAFALGMVVGMYNMIRVEEEGLAISKESAFIYGFKWGAPAGFALGAAAYVVTGGS